jgi:hypothetical protein
MGLVNESIYCTLRKYILNKLERQTVSVCFVILNIVSNSVMGVYVITVCICRTCYLKKLSTVILIFFTGKLDKKKQRACK